MIDRIAGLMRRCGDEGSCFPPTILYNENWMLRLTLDWCSGNPSNPLLPFMPGARWYSEGLLASAFLPDERGDRLAEGFTHADGIVGHFELGKSGRGDIILSRSVEQFVVIEGKMFSPLSRGVKNASDYDQAARNVACMAELLHRAQRKPADVSSLAFILIAPQKRIEEEIFSELVTKESIERKVEQRVKSYQARQDNRSPWLEQWFLPTLEKIEIGTRSWEEVVGIVMGCDKSYGAPLGDYYQDCLRWNSAAMKAIVADS